MYFTWVLPVAVTKLFIVIKVAISIELIQAEISITFLKCNFLQIHSNFSWSKFICMVTMERDRSLHSSALRLT